MKNLLAAALLGTTLAAPAAPATAWEPFPYCEATRLFVAYEASETFLVHGGARRNDSVKTTITCTIRRFGSTIRTVQRTAPGPVSAVAQHVGTPYGGMEICTAASYALLTGGFVSTATTCERIPAP